LIPAEITSISVSADADAESSLRTAVLEFVDAVRSVERAIAATRRGDSVAEELDVAPLGEVTEEEWREHWPSSESAVDGESGEAVDVPDNIDEAADDSGTDDEAEEAGDEKGVASGASGGGSKKRRGRR
jgi:XTP/dITP diphosphohydrolase